ncbi:MAG: hypothetical protein C0516_16010 [Gemmatimonas sp.]|nr:hypothetical protein [Gemmatimonas sp.]
MNAWLVPWAAAGFLALVVPLVVHRLSRRPPDVVRFPSLRLLEAAPLRPTQRARLDDRWLLLLRCAMLATVVAGLMQPVWSTGSSMSSAAERAPSVVVLVDTSSRTSATDAGDSSDTPSLRRLVSADHLRDELRFAVAWLRTRPMPRVIELRSDVPAWALDSADLAALPSDVTLRLVLHPPGMSVRRTSSAAGAADTLPWSTADAREAWWNVLAARQHLWQRMRHAWPPSRLAHAAPIASSVEALPLLFNMRGEAVVAAQYTAPTLQLVTARTSEGAPAQARADTAAATPLRREVREALSPRSRVAYPQHDLPLRDVYHAPEALTRWAAVASGPALGSGTTRDVHQQDTLARWFWSAALMLLALEQWLRSRTRT